MGKGIWVMKGFGAWLRQLGGKLSAGFRRFMTGRYGTDRLNVYILCASLLFVLLSMLLRSPIWAFLLTTVSYGLMLWALFRSLSRNTYRRYQENRRMLMFLERLKDREHRYYTCPKCRQSVRVPRGKGKIAITCPKCKEKFIKKT